MLPVDDDHDMIDNCAGKPKDLGPRCVPIEGGIWPERVRLLACFFDELCDLIREVRGAQFAVEETRGPVEPIEVFPAGIAVLGMYLIDLAADRRGFGAKQILGGLFHGVPAGLRDLDVSLAGYRMPPIRRTWTSVLDASIP